MITKEPIYKIYFECTFTHDSGINTGIQRVVRNFIIRNDLIEKQFGIETIPVVSIFGVFYQIKRTSLQKPAGRLFKYFETKRATVARIKQDSIHEDLSYKNRLVEFLSKNYLKIDKAIKYLKIIIWTGKKINFNSNETLVLLDAFWTYNLKQSLKKISNSKVRVLAVIYDLIPITFPQYVEEYNKSLFSAKLPTLLEMSDGFLCISDTVRDELKKIVIDKFKPIQSFKLGSDFNSKNRDDNNSGALPDDIRDLLTSGDFWLSVGTLEPRKNYDYILDAFDEIWKQNKKQRLLIVGRIGWNCIQLQKRINNHPLFGKFLFLKSDVNDETLSLLYNSSKGLIFASHAEGFGLPIVEAIAANIPVLCSDIPIFREVGLEYPEYFSLTKPSDLAKLLETTELKKSAKKTKLVSWDEATIKFIEKIKTM